MKEIVARDFVTVMIDTDRMTKGKEVAARLRHGKDDGLPWITILDGDGKELITGDGSKGNIGCPVQPEEIAHFMEMMRKTATRAPPADLEALESHLQAFADRILKKG